MQMPDAGPTVHGIDEDELLTSPPFDKAFADLVAFLQAVVATCLEKPLSNDVGNDPHHLPSIRYPPPIVLLASHTGLRFDFPLL